MITPVSMDTWAASFCTAAPSNRAERSPAKSVGASVNPSPSEYCMRIRQGVITVNRALPMVICESASEVWPHAQINVAARIVRRNLYFILVGLAGKFNDTILEMRGVNSSRFGLAILALCGLIASSAVAIEFDGVQPAALDQPRINMALQRSSNGPVLQANVDGEQVDHFEAFLDTGASSVVLCTHSAQQLQIASETSGRNGRGNPVRFEDVGVGGSSPFAVSEPLVVSLAQTQGVGPMRLEIGPLDAQNDLLTQLAMGDMDIAGMPAMQGRIVVMDPTQVNKMTDKIRTSIFEIKPNAKLDPQVPKTKWHVKLGFASFKNFTKTVPPGADGPAFSSNPFLGPDPLHPDGDKTPPLVVTHNGKSSNQSWLLDTGAVASSISRKEAAKLGVKYAEGTFGGNDPKLDGVPVDKQFSLSVGGIGGSKKSAGFYADKITLRTKEGEPITYLHAPVLVMDITVKDSTTGKEFTLDGVFGMNFLVASAKIDTSGLMPDIGKIVPGPFHLIVFDQPAGILGLD